MIESCAPSPTVGLFGIGLDTYWPQFPGLKERLAGYQTETHTLLEKAGAKVRCRTRGYGAKGSEPPQTYFEKRKSRLYSTDHNLCASQTVLVAQGSGAPIIIINMQPAKNIDYSWFNSLGDRGINDSRMARELPILLCARNVNVLNRNNIPYYLVTGFRGEEFIEHELNSWVKAAQVTEALRSANIGILGHYYEGMLDVYTDVTLMQALSALNSVSLKWMIWRGSARMSR